ncbi:hypothetical protein NL42_14885 [Acinetobacter sp. GN11]
MLNETEILMAIERLIIEVSQVLEKGDQTKRSTIQKLRAYARQGCDLVPAFKQMFTRNLQLMFPVNQFIRVIAVVDRLNRQYGLTHTEIPYKDEYIQICRALYVSQAAWSRDQNRFYRQEYNNRFKLEEYLRNIIQKHRQTLWVREELKYYTECLDELSIVDVERHLKTLRKRISDKDTCFKDLVGYAWALEQGGETGAYHIHLLLIYNGSKREGDWWHAESVGELWEKITGDFGKGFNKHTAKERKSYKEKGLDGLGMVKREDATKVNNAIRLGLYLADPTKYEQRLRVKVFGMKTFSHGQFTPSLYMLRQSREADDDIKLPF